MKALIALSCATLLIASTAYANSTLTADQDIKITAINGQAVNKSPFQAPQATFSLDAGRHVITARYDRLFDLSTKEHDYLKSDDITLTVELDDNQSYRLVAAGAPDNYQDARAYAKAPTLAIMQGTTKITEASAQESSQGLFDSLGSLFGRSSTKANQQAIAALNQSSTATVQAPTPASKPNASTLDKFMELWLNASEEEREKIRQWVQK